MAKIAIMGYGTVGGGVYDIIKSNAAKLEKNAGEKVQVAHILDIRDFDDHSEKELFTKDFDQILQDEETTVVVEVMGGLHPAYEFTKSLLEAGKSVVTSNKELVATYGTELLQIANDKNVNYLFEASVGGGIPIIRPMHQCLTANNVCRIAGILNGTTNYILYEMIKRGKSFDEALKDAQNKGFAERNPAADVEGHDACRKIAILASLASGSEVDYNDIMTEGITGVTLEDVKYAASMNSVVKLIGYAEFSEDGRIYAIVSPMILPEGSPLAGVDGVFNAIMVTGDCVGDVMFYGKGAGKLPTASAVVADVIDAVKHHVRSKKIEWYKPEQNIMIPSDQKEFSYFIRTTSSPEKVQKLFGKCEFVDNIVRDEAAFITPKMKGSQAKEKMGQLGNIVSSLRIFE